MQTRKRIAVAGATGRAGRHAVDVLRERGHDLVDLARQLAARQGDTAQIQGVHDPNDGELN